MGLIREANTARKLVKKAGAFVRSDDEVAADLRVLLDGIGSKLEAAKSHPSANASLREAFNDVAMLLPVGHRFVEKGKLSMPQLIGVARRRKKLERSATVLSEAFNAGNPAVMSVVAYAVTSKPLRRVAGKAEGSFYRFQGNPDGTGVLNMLPPLPSGVPGSLPLDKVQYTLLKMVLKQATIRIPPPKP